MTKRFCDRCGKEIKEREPWSRIEIENKDRRAGRDDDYIITYEACEECMEKLHKFMKNEFLENVFIHR